MDIWQELEKRAWSHAHQIALIQNDETVSFQTWLYRAQGARDQLQRLGIGRGDAVALLLPNCIEFAYLYCAILGEGAIATPIDHRMGLPELRNILARTKVKVVFTTPNHPHLAALQTTHVTIPIARGEPGFFSAPATPPAMQPAPDESTALYLHTSGTTNQPKIVELTAAHLDEFPRAMLHAALVDGRDVWGMVLPMSHISGPIVVNAILCSGGAMVIFDQLTPQHVLGAIERHRITLIHGVPPIFQMLLKGSPTDYDTSSLRMLAMMGTSVPLPVIRAVQAAFPHARLLQGYGLTETGPLLTLMPFDEAADHLDSIGKAVVDAELAIMDAQGHLLGPGEEGEIVGRGPMIMKGYLDDPEATQARWRQGWFRTGDAGRYDQDGFFYHLGRLDDMIVTGQGLNVFPSEVEVCLLEHDDVLEAAVVGRRDRDRGAELHAFVVLRPGAAASATELRAHCTQNLASYKVPRRVHIMPELPKNATGKVVKTALAAGGAGA